MAGRPKWLSAGMWFKRPGCGFATPLCLIGRGSIEFPGCPVEAPFSPREGVLQRSNSTSMWPFAAIFRRSGRRIIHSAFNKLLTNWLGWVNWVAPIPVGSPEYAQLRGRTTAGGRLLGASAVGASEFSGTIQHVGGIIGVVTKTWVQPDDRSAIIS